VLVKYRGFYEENGKYIFKFSLIGEDGEYIEEEELEAYETLAFDYFQLKYNLGSTLSTVFPSFFFPFMFLPQTINLLLLLLPLPLPLLLEKEIEVVEAFYLTYSHPMAIAVLTLSLIFVIIIILTGVVVFMKRETPVIKSASPTFFLLILLGILLSFLSFFPFVGKPSVSSCIAPVFLYPLAFAIVFGSLPFLH